MASTTYPDPESSQIGPNNSGLYVANQPADAKSATNTPPQQHQQHQQQQQQQQHHQQSAPQHDNGGMMLQDQEALRQQLTQSFPEQAPQPQMLAQNVMDQLQDHRPELHDHPANSWPAPTHEPSSARKRLKVSRACDECRRKKIRCDAGIEEMASCTSCRKSNKQCSYSRQPQKRGPSKGYIKELADRLKDLEQHIHDPSLRSSMIAEQGLTGFNETGDVPHGLKRRLSMLENGENHFDGNNSGAFEGDLEAFLTGTSEETRGRIDMWYQHVQPIFPILPEESVELLARLAMTPPEFQTGFLTSMELGMLVLSPEHSAISQDTQDFRQPLMQITQGLGVAEFTPGSTPGRAYWISDKLLRAACTALTALFADYHRPSLGTSPGKWISQCVTDLMRLQEHELAECRSEGHRTFAFAQRLSGMLFILDRMSAAGESSGNLCFPEDATDMLNRLHGSVDEHIYQLSRVAEIVGFIVMSRGPAVEYGLSTGNRNFLSEVLGYRQVHAVFNAQLNRSRLQATDLDLPADDPVHAGINHGELLVAQLSPYSSPTLLLRLTKQLVDSLNGPTYLTHHFAALAVITVAAVARHPEVKRDELKHEFVPVVDAFIERLSNGDIFPLTSVGGQAWTKMFRDSLVQSKSQLSDANGDTSGLHNLAEAASTERDEGEEGTAATRAAQTQATAAAAQMQLQDFFASRDPRQGYLSQFNNEQ